MPDDEENWCSQFARYLLNADYRWCHWQFEFLRYMAFNPPRNPSERQIERLRHLAKRLLNNERLKRDRSDGSSATAFHPTGHA